MRASSPMQSKDISGGRATVPYPLVPKGIRNAMGARVHKGTHGSKGATLEVLGVHRKSRKGYCRLLNPHKSLIFKVPHNLLCLSDVLSRVGRCAILASRDYTVGIRSSIPYWPLVN